MKKSNQARVEPTPPVPRVNITKRKVLVWKTGFFCGPKTVAEALGRTQLAVLV